MATTTPNYGWDVPTSTDYVAQGAVAIEALGDDIDAFIGTAFNNKLRPGLVLVKSQAISTPVASVTVTSAFSSTYDSYLIILSNIGASASMNLTFQMGTNNTNYYWTEISGAAYSTPNGNVVFTNGNNQSSYTTGCIAATGVAAGATITVNNPFDAATTVISSQGSDPRTTGTGPRTASGFHNLATSFTSFTINAVGGNLTGGKINVYGYAKD